jgi:dihydrofolate synthase/folylpolyglutamate synthase
MIVGGSDPVSRRLERIGQEFGPNFSLELDRMHAALNALGDPHLRLPPVLHVAGTNGKGSTCAFLRAIIEGADLKAHVFTSPHLITPNERIRVAGRLADDDALIDAIDRVAAVGVEVSYFEALTAAAFLLFAETPADAVVLEVGLGGRLDATNMIARPAASVITPIGFDHMAILGATLGAIAGEKAGILKRGAPAVIARQTVEAAEVLAAQAESVGAPLMRCGVEWDCWRQSGRLAVQTHDRLLDLPAPALFGPHQYENAGLAVAAALAWGDPRIDEDALASGVASAVWPGRMQRLKRGVLAETATASGAELWLDGGHNPHGAAAIAAALDEMAARAPAPVVLVVGMLANKDLNGFLEPLLARAHALVATGFASKNARAASEIAAHAAERGAHAMIADDVRDAVARAAQHAPGARILICGSLYLAGEALALSGGVE